MATTSRGGNYSCRPADWDYEYECAEFSDGVAAPNTAYDYRCAVIGCMETSPASTLGEDYWVNNDAIEGKTWDTAAFTPQDMEPCLFID